MNIKRFALGGFRNTSDDGLMVRGTTVLLAMTNNPYFPDPHPSIADASAVLADFQSKLSIARRRGNPQETAVKNASRLALENTLGQLAFYVSNVADGDLQILLSSGFELNNMPTKTDVPDVVNFLKLSEGRQSGQMRLDFAKQKHALMYEYQYGLKPEDALEPEWGDLFTTTSSKNNLLAPLQSFVRYYVQVRAVNALGKSAWSDPASFITR